MAVVISRAQQKVIQFHEMCADFWMEIKSVILILDEKITMCLYILDENSMSFGDVQ